MGEINVSSFSEKMHCRESNLLSIEVSLHFGPIFPHIFFCNPLDLEPGFLILMVTYQTPGG